MADRPTRDRRAFAAFDVGYLDNPKMLDILDESLAAALMHAASILYASAHLTDGEVPPRVMQRKVGGTPEDVQLLIRSGLWHEQGHDCPSCPPVPQGRVYVHDYLQHNRSKAQAERASEAGRKGAAARHHGEGKKPSARVPQSGSHADRSADRTPDACDPHADRNAHRQTDRQTEEEPLAHPQAGERALIERPTRFPEFYAAWPKKKGKLAAEKAWPRAVRAAGSEQAIIDAAAAYAANPYRPEREFIPYPATWLNRGGWEDELDGPKQARGGAVEGNRARAMEHVAQVQAAHAVAGPGWEQPPALALDPSDDAGWLGVGR